MKSIENKNNIDNHVDKDGKARNDEIKTKYMYMNIYYMTKNILKGKKKHEIFGMYIFAQP